MKDKKDKFTPCSAIREKCIDCCGGQMVEVRECKIKDCSLWGFRMGKNPNRTGKGGRKDWIKGK